MTGQIIGIGNIGNYYGGLLVKEESGKFFWAIMDYTVKCKWEQIPASLYKELMAFENQQKLPEGGRSCPRAVEN